MPRNGGALTGRLSGLCRRAALPEGVQTGPCRTRSAPLVGNGMKTLAKCGLSGTVPLFCTGTQSGPLAGDPCRPRPLHIRPSLSPSVVAGRPQAGPSPSYCACTGIVPHRYPAVLQAPLRGDTRHIALQCAVSIHPNIIRQEIQLSYLMRSTPATALSRSTFLNNTYSEALRFHRCTPAGLARRQTPLSAPVGTGHRGERARFHAQARQLQRAGKTLAEC